MGRTIWMEKHLLALLVDLVKVWEVRNGRPRMGLQLERRRSGAERAAAGDLRESFEPGL